MSIGYACMTVGVPDTKIRGCILRNAKMPKLEELAKHNLKSLENIFEYNNTNNIRLFRISSDIIPFASKREVEFPWKEMFAKRLVELGVMAKEYRIRLSMHPGQYTVLNSQSKETVKRAVEDLEYHCDFLDAMQLGRDCKIVLHIGGVYDDKKSAMERFATEFKSLSDNIRSRLIIENDDKSYHPGEVVELADKLGIPAVYDNLHSSSNPGPNPDSDIGWINIFSKTWKESDGKQKIHYSQQDPKKSPGSHSSTIDIEKFVDFYKSIDGENMDVMLEVKDKNISAVKCIQAVERKRGN